jgi:hypothetical protein
MIFFGVVVLVYTIYLAYWPWFKPQEYRMRTLQYRKKIHRDWPFLPENVIYPFLKKHTRFDLWYARIGYLSMIVLIITIIVISYLSFRFVINP